MLPSPLALQISSVRCLAGAGLLACALAFAPGLALAQPAGGTGDGKGRVAPTTSPQQPSAGGTNRSMRVPPGSWLQPRAQRSIVPAMDETRFVPDEVLFELAPNVEAETVLRRYGATLIASQRFELAGVTIIRARIEAGRDLRAVLTAMAEDTSIAGAQPNFLFELQQDSQSRAGVPAGATTASSEAATAPPPPSLRLADPATAARGSAAVRRILPPQ